MSVRRANKPSTEEVGLRLSSKHLSQCEIKVNHLLRFAVDWRLIQIETDVETNRTDRRVVTEAASDDLAKIPQTDLRHIRKYVSRVIKSGGTEIFDRHPGQREAVLEISDYYGVAAALGSGFIEVVSAKRRRSAGEVANRNQCLFGHTIGMDPSHP